MLASSTQQRSVITTKHVCPVIRRTCKRIVAANVASSRRELAIAAGTIFSVLPLQVQATTQVTQDPKFIAETNKLSASIRTYMSLDPFDKTRIEALNEVKTEGKAWIAAHAKGGSAPGQAAKRMYVAVDAVQGHASANGAAPLPKQKVKFVSNVLDEVDVLISQGK